MERNKALDILKGFGIILMVLGHMHFDDVYFAKYIFGFHMPLFFIASGFLYNENRTIKQTVISKTRSLLIPYILFGGGYYIIYLLLNPHDPDKLEPLISLFFRGVSGLKIESALWFLPAMFFAIVVYRIIGEIINESILKTVVIIALSIFGCLCSICFGIRLPLGLDSSLASLLFIYVGNEFRKNGVIHRIYKLRRRKYRYYLCLFSLLFLNGFSIFVNGDLNMRQAHWGFIPLTYINGTVATVIYWLIAMDVERCRGCFNKWLCRISSNSIVYLCLNHLVIRYSERLMSFVEDRIGFKNIVIHEIIVFFLTMGVIYIIAEFIVKTPLRLIIGRSLKKTKS